MDNRKLWIGSGVAGIIAMFSYIFTITYSWPLTQAANSALLLCGSAFPILSMIMSYGMFTYIAVERDGTANRLALIFSVTAFTTLLLMLIVQFAIRAALGTIIQGLDADTGKSLSQGLQLIHLGLDVAWDMLIGTSMIWLGVAMRKRRGLGLGWGLPAMILGIALIVLNTVTFPWPPGEHGLFDVGPVVGLFITALAVRLLFLGLKASPKAD